MQKTESLNFKFFFKKPAPKGNLIFIVLLSILLLSFVSCKKYLEEKPSQQLTVPSTLTDLQSLLDNESASASSPGDLEFVSDNYYFTTQTWTNNSTQKERLMYAWDKDAQITSDYVWTQPYYVIYQANLVLDQLFKISFDEGEELVYNNVKGTAFFYRSFLFHQLAQLFCKPYSSASASADPGIILRLIPNVTSPSRRSTVQETYDQIISDLKAAASLLPINNHYTTRPNKAAAYGELARVYLSMRDYTNAGKYADSSLSINKDLLDYNTLVAPSPPGLPLTLPVYTANPEISYLSYLGFEPGIQRDAHQQLIDSFLYQSYAANDLRKRIFFRENTGSGAGTYYWQGSYFNFFSKNISFDGIATDEIYLIRAECRAKANDVIGAMNDLNILMRNRWVTGTYTDTTSVDSTDALNKIRRERRKELLFRGLRWSDLRRLNLEGANITLKRIVNGTSYELPANSPRWVLLIPQIEIDRSNIAQNPR